MNDDLKAPLFGIVVGSIILFVVLIFCNPQIESQCLSKGGQVISTPGRISSCLYSAK